MFAVSKAVEVLDAGGVIIFPTETSYGLGVDSTNKSAIKRLYAIKQMPLTKKVAAMVSDKERVQKFYGLNKKVDRLIDTFLPGPLTIIYKGDSFRIPNHKFCLDLCKAFKKPITCTSANLSGKPDLFSLDQILKEGPKVDLIIDGGKLKKGKLSTVYDVDRDVILRQGRIKEKKIRKAIVGMK